MMNNKLVINNLNQLKKFSQKLTYKYQTWNKAKI